MDRNETQFDHTDVAKWQSLDFTALQFELKTFMSQFTSFLNRSNFSPSTVKQYVAIMATAFRVVDARDSAKFDRYLTKFSTNSAYTKRSAYRMFREFLYGERSNSAAALRTALGESDPTGNLQEPTFLFAPGNRNHANRKKQLYFRCLQAFKRFGSDVIRGIELGYINESFTSIINDIMIDAKERATFDTRQLSATAITALEENLTVLHQMDLIRPQGELSNSPEKAAAHTARMKQIAVETTKLQAPDNALEPAMEQKLKELHNIYQLPIDELRALATSNPEEINVMYKTLSDTPAD